MHLFVMTLVRRTIVYLLVATTLVACSDSGPSEPETQGAQPRMRLITTDQHVNTLMYVFGSSVHTQGEFSPVERKEGFMRCRKRPKDAIWRTEMLIMLP